MNLKKLTLAAASVGLLTSVAVTAPASATPLTVSPTSCVLTIPSKSVITRETFETRITLTQSDLNCPAEANPFLTTEINFVGATNYGYATWALRDNSTYYGRTITANFYGESIAGPEYGTKRIVFSVYDVGNFTAMDKGDLGFIQAKGPDETLNTDDDILYPMTFSNGIVQKFQSDVSVKTKKIGGNIKVSVKVDRNLYEPNDFLTPKYIQTGDKVKVYRDGKFIKSVKVGTNGKATFYVADKVGSNKYSVVLPENKINFEGKATFVK